MKEKIHKLTAFILTGASIVTMGACSNRITESEKKAPTTPTTTANFSIFDDPELLSTSNISFIEETATTTTKKTTEQPETTHASQILESRFSSQEELETYLTNIYESSGKNYIQIINEYHEAQKENYYIYQEDVYTAAAYMMIRENGYTLDELALELDYLLASINKPRGLYDEDMVALKTLYNICDSLKGEAIGRISVYQIFEQLSLERHKVACVQKNEHQHGNEFIECETLDEVKLFYAIMDSRGESLTQ